MNAGMHEFLAQDRVVWGKPAAEAVVEEADRRGVFANRQHDLDASRPRGFFIEAGSWRHLRQPPRQRDPHLAVAPYRDEGPAHQQAAHHRPQEVAQQRIEVERGVQQLRRFEQRLELRCTKRGGHRIRFSMWSSFFCPGMNS